VSPGSAATRSPSIVMFMVISFQRLAINNQLTAYG
jgi:hypothetical protein